MKQWLARASYARLQEGPADGGDAAEAQPALPPRPPPQRPERRCVPELVAPLVLQAADWHR
jgi:hypothetical protein